MQLTCLSDHLLCLIAFLALKLIHLNFHSIIVICFLSLMLLTFQSILSLMDQKILQLLILSRDLSYVGFQGRIQDMSKVWFYKHQALKLGVNIKNILRILLKSDFISILYFVVKIKLHLFHLLIFKRHLFKIRIHWQVFYSQIAQYHFINLLLNNLLVSFQVIAPYFEFNCPLALIKLLIIHLNSFDQTLMLTLIQFLQDQL